MENVIKKKAAMREYVKWSWSAMTGRNPEEHPLWTINGYEFEIAEIALGEIKRLEE